MWLVGGEAPVGLAVGRIWRVVCPHIRVSAPLPCGFTRCSSLTCVGVLRGGVHVCVCIDGFLSTAHSEMFSFHTNTIMIAGRKAFVQF